MACPSPLDDLRFTAAKLAVDHARAGKDRGLLARRLVDLSDAYQRMGNRFRAEFYLIEALHVYRGDPKASPLDVANCRRRMAAFEAERRRRASARARWDESLARYRALEMTDRAAEASARRTRRT